jgi:hypothetical protein
MVINVLSSARPMNRCAGKCVGNVRYTMSTNFSETHFVGLPSLSKFRVSLENIWMGQIGRLEEKIAAALLY